MSEPSNSQRAEWAYEALMAFAARAGLVASGDSEDMSLVLRDFLCDAMHYCDQNGIEFDYELQAARDHFSFELAEEKEQRESS